MARPLQKRAAQPPRQLKPRRGTPQGIQKPTNRTLPAPGASPAVSPSADPTSGLLDSLPVDPIYTGDNANVDLQYGNVMSGINYDYSQLGQQYGFQPAFLQNGQPNPNAGALDPSNPYSVAANLQRRYQQGQAGTTNSNAAQGQLYSGANQRQLDQGTFNYSRDYDTARRSADRASLDLAQRSGQAGIDQLVGHNNAFADRLGRLSPNDIPPPTTAAKPKPNAVARRVTPKPKQDTLRQGPTYKRNKKK